MTQRLYDLDSSVTEFDCQVINLYTEDDGTVTVMLDRTAFFPAGGGQTSDRGTLDDGYVENVEIRDGEILHHVKNCKENVNKWQIGTRLHGKIDTEKRFSDMQQHSGEHVLSGIVHRVFGYQNVGFHLSEREVTVDFDGILEENDVCKVEDLVNQVIWENRNIRVFYPTDAEKETLSFRSKKEVDGPLRLVEIEGVDLCACCAPHVKQTGEIGSFRVVKHEKNRGGTRLWILCGKRNLLDAREKLSQNKAVSVMLSCKQTETAQYVHRLKEERDALCFDLVGARRNLLLVQADEVAPGDRLVQFLDADGDTLLRFAEKLGEKAAQFAAVFSEGEEKKFVLLTQTGYALEPVMAMLRDRFQARGGGRGNMIRGAVTAEQQALYDALEQV